MPLLLLIVFLCTCRANTDLTLSKLVESSDVALCLFMVTTEDYV